MADVIFGANQSNYDRYDSGVFSTFGDKEGIMIRKSEGQILMSRGAWRHCIRGVSFICDLKWTNFGYFL